MQIPGVVHLDFARPESAADAFVLGDAEGIPFKSCTFESVLAKDVLEHLESPIDALIELRRVVRRGGRLTVVTPRPIPRAVWDDPTHIRGFTRGALDKAFALSGWRAEGQIRRIGSVPGVGRLGLQSKVEAMLMVPGLGHYFGTNWIARCRAV